MKLPSELQQLLLIIQDYKPYLVGGCVRDHLLGKEPHDFDIVVDKVHHSMLREIIDAGWSTKLSLNGSTEIWNVSKKFPIYDFTFYKDEPVILGKSACYFNVSEGISKEYIRYNLKTTEFINYAIKNATGSTIKNVGLKTMREYLVPLPIIKNEQYKIVNKPL